MMKFNAILINPQKPLYSCFVVIPGVHLYTSHKFMAKLGYDLMMPFRDVNKKKYKQILVYLEILYQIYLVKVEYKEQLCFKYIKQKCYKGWRLLFHLPLNGQNTHNNRRTRKRFRIF